ncbi:MAG: universal stress protein [Rubrivivax sp.]|nr:universal stress protein [Rubrivivax sp.]MDP3085725.1 universal stress protein [Rubrivivax sp.]
MNDAETQNPAPTPTPTAQRRDDIDRLIAVTWHGAGASDDAGRRHWLAAVDGSDCSLRSLSMVVRLVEVERSGAVDLVNVQPWLVKEAAETELPRRGWQATAQARQLLDAASIRWRLHVVMGEAAPEIARMAQALGSRGIAIGSHGLTAAESLLLGSVAYQVVHLAKGPVLIVR